MNLKKIFSKPKIISICANINEGKSMLIYHLIEELKKIGKFNLVVYGLRVELKDVLTIHSVEELEQIKNSIIIIDEVMSLWDLDNRVAKRQIETSLRLLFHNNNVLLICGLPENFKKFISGKVNSVFFKKVTFADLINGSRMKNIIMNYKGNEKGNTILNLDIDECLFFDGLNYEKFKVPYLKKYDTKKDNVPIIQEKFKKSVTKSVNNIVSNPVVKEEIKKL
jgi:hypothetical protein